MTVEAALEAFALGFTSALEPPGANPFAAGARIVPPAGAGERLMITDLVTTTEITPGTLDLTWRTKDVRFVNPDIVDPTTVGGQPTADLLTPGIATTMTGAAIPPGVPGLLGTVGGTLPIPIDVTKPVEFPVTLWARWRTLDEQGNGLSDTTWTVGGGGPGLEGTGGIIQPPSANALDVVTVVFNAVFVELTSDPNPTAKRKIEASIRLEAAGTSTAWIDLVPLDLIIPAVPVPTVAIFHQRTNFGGLVFIVVPASSPLDSGSVSIALNTLKNTLDPLQAALAVLGLIVGALDGVRTTLSSGEITFRKADQLGNLNNIDLDSGFFNDTEAEDELSSLVLIGPPRRQLQTFNARDYSTSEGQMNVTVGPELIVSIGTLHSGSPSGNPAGRVSVPHAPSGQRWSGLNPWHDITGFGDELSSLRWSWTS